jgi:hypothetical protein
LADKSAHSVYDTSGYLKDTFLTGPIELEFAGRYFKQPDGPALDFTPDSNALGVEISGKLGFDVLRNIEFKIDYRDGLVDFGRDKKPEHC